MTPFEVITADHLSEDLLKGLFAGTVAAVRMPDYFPGAACQTAVERFKAAPRIDPRGGSAANSIVGITRMQYGSWNDPQGKEKYFARSPECAAMRQQIVGDLLERIIAEAGRAWPGGARLAVEASTEQPYFAGQFRVMNGGSKMHRDWPVPDGRSWTIEGIDAILTWNVYLQVSQGGGTVRIYDVPARREDDVRVPQPGYEAYVHSLVEGAPYVEISPAPGELIFFNAGNYHKVMECSGELDRVTFSSFVGRDPRSGALLFWS